MKARANYRKNEINCPDPEAAQKMIEELTKIKAAGDSCGGVVEIVAKGVPAGRGTGLRQAERDDRPCHVVHRGRKRHRVRGWL